jgi:hypothetical protein
MSGRVDIDSKASVPSSFIENEYAKPPLSEFTIGEYGEKVIQFGYIVVVYANRCSHAQMCAQMFAASFPLAPLLALIINLIDLRMDARRLLWWNRRPIGLIATDIGIVIRDNRAG